MRWILMCLFAGLLAACAASGSVVELRHGQGYGDADVASAAGPGDSGGAGGPGQR